MQKTIPWVIMEKGNMKLPKAVHQCFGSVASRFGKVMGMILLFLSACFATGVAAQTFTIPSATGTGVDTVTVDGAIQGKNSSNVQTKLRAHAATTAGTLTT